MTLPDGNGTLIPRKTLAGQVPQKCLEVLIKYESRTEHETPSSFIKEEEYQAIYRRWKPPTRCWKPRTAPATISLGWMYLPREYDKDEFARIKEAAAKIREDSDVLVVAGIGGSYLGARAVVEAVKGQFHNELDSGLKIYFCGNSISPLI